MASQPGQLFVGRQREMETLLAALNDALEGRGRVVMLAGEPGIGKTRTAQELARLATDKGAHILWGWCYDQQGAPAYWPWLQAIRSYVQQRDADLLRLEMGPGAADIAGIVPDINGKLPGLTPPPPLEPEEARFRMFDSIVTFLTTAAQHQPLVLVLDDLHWADKPSLLLLEFLVRQMSDSRILVVGCYRDTELTRQHPLPETLAQLSREPVFQRASLRGLSHEDSDLFIAASAASTGASSDATLPQELLDSVYDRTEGNPFFTSEVIRLLSDSGDLDPDTGTAHAVRIPDGVREVIGQRLNRLSEHCNLALTMASVIGREFDFNLLRRLDPAITEEKWLEGIDEGVAARLIEEVPEEIDRYRFSHALIRQSLSEELTTSRRVRLHARVGEALEELYRGDEVTHAGELVYHFSEAQTVLGTQKLVRYCLAAGENALDVYAYEEALAYYQRGLTAQSGQPTDEDTAKLWAGLGRCQASTLPLFQLPEAVASLSKAFDYYANAGNVDQAVAIAEQPFPPTAGRRQGVLQIIERALELVAPTSRQAGRLLARYGWLMGIEEANYEGSRDALARALDIARSEDDSMLALRTLVSAQEVEGIFLHHEEALSRSLEAIALLTEIDDPRSDMLAHFWAGYCSIFHLGDPVEGERHFIQSMAAAERLRHHFYLGRAFLMMSWLSYCKGEWQAAREFSDRGLLASPRETRLLHSRIVLEYEVGNFSDGKTYLDRLLEVMRLTTLGPVYEYAFPVLAISMAARISGDPGWFAVARAAGADVLSDPSVTPMVAAMTKTGFALIAEQQQDVAAAKELYEGLERHQIVGTLGPQVDRLLGLLAQTAGGVSEASVHFEDALSFCRKAGFRPELAWTCHDYADMLIQRNNDGDRAKAMSLLGESLAISVELGMRPLMERVATLRERADAGPVRVPAYPDGLTEREVGVLRLISAGKTDRQIADELVISIRTATTHVGNILNKTGVANRTEAAAYAIRRGLAADEDAG